MRLVKTVLVGARLYAFYEAQDRRELRDMVASLSRIEARLEERARPNGAVGMPAERLA